MDLEKVRQDETFDTIRPPARRYIRVPQQAFEQLEGATRMTSSVVLSVIFRRQLPLHVIGGCRSRHGVSCVHPVLRLCSLAPILSYMLIMDPISRI